jgi:hypothetical protein
MTEHGIARGATIARPTYFRDNPLKELARSKPSDVMSLYSTSAKNLGDKRQKPAAG